jgi:murein hydrolase activator
MKRLINFFRNIFILNKYFICKMFILNTLNIIIIFNVNAQNKRGELEANRQQLLKQIETTNQQLNQNKVIRSAASDRLEALQGQIENREALINNLQVEIAETDAIIERTEDVLNALNDDVHRLNTEYGVMMRKAYRMKMPNNALVFLLSSNNFSDAYQRWQYFKQYDKFRQRQAKLIMDTQKSLSAKNESLTQQKQQKELLAGTNISQKKILTEEKKEKDRLLAELKDDQRRLAGELKSQEKKNVQLNGAIERLIEAEIDAKRRAAEERARRNREEANRLARERDKERRKQKTEVKIQEPEARNEEIITESSENLALSSDFRSNKGKLPPPATGTIVREFGRQRVLDKVTAVNNGIDIRTAPNGEVRAVFNGIVSVVSSIAGLGYVVLVQHGNYYTVYSNMSTVSVKKGEAVSTRQVIGRAGLNTVTNDSEVHFEVWLEKTHLNPTSWIAK